MMNCFMLSVGLKLTNPSSTSVHGTPLLEGHLSRSRECPLNRGSSVVQAPVVQKVDSAIRWINLSIHWIAQLISPILIRWIVINPVDSDIQRLNNRSLTAKIKNQSWVNL